MSSDALKTYINEILRVTVQRIDPSGKKGTGKTYTKNFDIPDDEADELDWFLDNYARPVINYKVKKETDKETGEKKTVKVYDEMSEGQIKDLLKRLANIEDDPEKFNAEKLINVMLPWGESGFKAVKYIATHTERTGVPFPFMKLSARARVGSSIDFSKLNLSPQVLKYVYETNPRIGKNDTGKGEFLLALLTGGIAGTEGLHGDISINGKDWEVKSPTEQLSARVVRLGDLPSDTFRKLFKQFYENNKTIRSKLKPRNEDPYKSAESTLEALASREGYNKLRGPTGKDYPDIFAKNGVLNKALIATLEETGIEGFALVTPEGVKFVSTDSCEFYNAGGKSGRIHVIFPRA